nr:hypothetical protein [Dickeya sp. NCPPB 3274]
MENKKSGRQYAITQLSKHTNVYRGFSIIKCPRTISNPITRYRVSQSGQSYGLFDALTLATGYIDNLYTARR